MHSKAPPSSESASAGVINGESEDCAELVENTSLHFQPLISLTRDYLARLLFWLGRLLTLLIIIMLSVFPRYIPFLLGAWLIGNWEFVPASSIFAWQFPGGFFMSSFSQANVPIFICDLYCHSKKQIIRGLHEDFFWSLLETAPLYYYSFAPIIMHLLVFQ